MDIDDMKIPMEVQPSCVVGIGASAGGLEALQQFLTFLPKDTGMAFVIIQHLSPDHKSLLGEILSKYSALPVQEARDGMQVKRNNIYLLPPKYNIEITSDVLHLKEYNHALINHPIDIFFRSLATAYENRAVAVIMSGTGSDGTNGIRSIKEQNGMIIVQNPETAKFDGMPRNAIATGFVDLILGPDAIAKEMAHISSSINLSNGKMQLTDGDLMSQVFSILKSVTNTNYTYYKQTTILRRIERRIVVTHCRNLQSYVQYLQENQDEAKTLAKEVLIGVTSFFRDPEFFEVLKQRVIKDIVQNGKKSDQIRVWVAGCSTGEEAYSIAILFAEVMEELNLRRDVKIFATDLDADSITFAGRGVYGENIIEDVSVSRLSRFFTRKGSKYVVNHDIRTMIVFAQHNVFQDPPFGRLNLISCRNLLIYFQSVLQKNLFSIFHIALNDGGYLFLGKSESVGEYSDVFRTVCSNEKIFIHNAAGRKPSHARIPYSMQGVEDNLELPDNIRSHGKSGAEYPGRELDTRVLEALMPACVVVDTNNELRHSYGDCSRFLTIPAGTATLDIFLLLRQDLKIAFSTALKKARVTGKRVAYDHIPVKLDKEPENITVVALPVTDKTGAKTGYTAVAFIRSDRKVTGPVEKYDIDTAAANRISDLEKDLRVTQDSLHQTVMELESVNAELQAANEELLTSNEELQSSNEELQSVNEELYTVNSEYQSKVSEIAAVNNDMANFLSTTLIGIMMVDRDMNIRKFTEYIASEFNVAEQDVGRSLQYIAYNFSSINLMDLSRKVLNTMETVECETTSVTGKTYLIRIAPYRVSKEQEDDPGAETEDLKGNTEKNKRNAGKDREQKKNLRGLVITFVDLTKQINDEQQLEEISEALRIAAKTSQEKENFLSRMSHDMRTPLTTILGLLELTLTKEKMSDPVRENLEKMQSSGRYLLSLINEVLETSKLDAGKVVSEYDVVHEKDVFEEVNTIIEEKARSAGIHYHFEISNCRNEVILMDVDHVARILVNLLGNAVKFTEKGGDVSLMADVVYLDEGRVEHTYRIKDTGIGISREFLPKMYLPFEQDSAAQSRNREGTGLGLFISRRLINLLGGTIDCRSEVGKGTEFTVKLAYDVASEDQRKLMRRAEKKDYDIRNLKGKRVLVVEDNQINAEVIMHILEWNGLVADHAENGRNALEKFKMSLKNGPKYDVVLMDLRMPVMDGFECARKIRELKNGWAQKIPIIALSADVYDRADEECYENGMNARVAKPIDTGELFRVLEREIMKNR